MAKLKGSIAKNPKTRVTGSSQVGRFGCLSACHSSRRSLRLIRQSLNILRVVPHFLVIDDESEVAAGAGLLALTLLQGEKLIA